ncbi:MAG: site-specific integrase [Candidatus Dadabacteria bacterium]|nr:site-specific integrase [Candidatus Dadabacteria bacterium]NIS09361.1 site-specific integrase [Candidatus Dadabacteria bacterium]NIV42371.1 tyrosine-type recombinase/integrase [Candidatus Dadabacteria bacterium]NIX15897.1 tyrosine-type recombinase/integrase [Candidatus Dadabacteria bacterium]NIY22604.1 tyrosine-type recombinase/integrase [Candidatus Dadabacteria bacterium]
MGVFKRWITSKKGKTAYWYIRYTVNKKLKWESVGKVGEVTKAVAQTHLEERKKQIRLGTYGVMTTEIPTLSEYKDEYYKYVKDIKQIRSHIRTKQVLDRFECIYGSYKLNEISSEIIDSYKAQRQNDGAKNSTINRELTIISGLFSYAYKNKKFFGINPVSEAGKLEDNTVMERILKPGEETKLLACCEGYLKDIVQIALNTGMRQGEIFRLRWDWIDFNNNFIALPQTHTKSKKERKIPLNQTVRKILMKRKLSSGGSDYVFMSPQGLDQYINNVTRSFRTACKKAGIENLRFHDLRHTAATRLVEYKIPIHTVSKLLGHMSVRTTERYSHPEDTLKDAVNILENKR